MLRRTYLLLLGMWLLCLHPQVHAQVAAPSHATEFSVGLNHIDRSLRLDHWMLWGRHGLRLGVKYHLWWNLNDDRRVVLRERAYAGSGAENFGFQLGYTFDVLKANSGLRLYGFYDAQFSKTSFWIREYIPQGNVTLASPANLVLPSYELVKGSRGPAWAIEQNVGLGLRMPIGKRLMFNEMTGLGLATAFWGKDAPVNGKSTTSEFIFPFWRVGLAWRWGANNQL